MYVLRRTEAKKKTAQTSVTHLHGGFLTVENCVTEHHCHVRMRNTPVEDVWQVKLQQTFSQGHKRQQAGVEEEQKQQPSAHGEAVRHGAVLQENTGHRIKCCAGNLESIGYLKRKNIFMAIYSDQR